MDLTPAILDLAVDDYTGLWEIRWRANALMPQASAEETYGAALAGTRELISCGFLSAFRGTRFPGDEVALSATEAAAVLEDPHSWDPPIRSGPHVRVAATEAGGRTYFSR